MLPSLREIAVRTTIAAFTLAAAAATPARAPAQVPDTDIWLATLTVRDGQVLLGEPRNVTKRHGYDNQPAFLPNGDALLYVSQRGTQTDIYRYDVRRGTTQQFTRTAESEYSPTPAADGRSYTVVRVEADSAQRLWRFPMRVEARPELVLPNVRPVGYFAWSGPHTVVMFVLGDPNMLQVARVGSDVADTVVTTIGRSVQPVPGGETVSFVHEVSGVRLVKLLDPATGAVSDLFAPLDSSQDLAWVDERTALMAHGARIYARSRGANETWREVGDFGGAGVETITRIVVSRRRGMIAFVATTTESEGDVVP